MNLLAFSTLGCPSWDLDRILAAAVEYGYDAIELRGYLSEVDLSKAAPFARERRAETRTRFADAGIAVCCVSSSGVVAEANTEHVRVHAALARDLGCPVVRVFGGALDGEIPPEEALARAAQNLRAFGDAAESEGVKIVLETHDAFSTGAAVAELLTLAAHPAVFSLWDLHHPYRQNEPFEETFRFLAPTLTHLHIKDSRDGAYTLLGDGDVPLFPMLDLLLTGGYAGPISLEWEKRWVPEIADPEVAFPQYAEKLRAYLRARRQ
ncbi:MAG: sugar phosphate isomerase/epimerase [Cytophagales bacterium]|nr:sugar phosphate isomerase/epimerase [Armatimonadota bacterium]